MNSSVLLVIVLSAGGHWWADTSVNVQVAPVVESVNTRIARYQWVLAIDGITLATGESESAGDNLTTTITFDAPRVRVATPMLWVLQAYDADGGMVAESRHAVHVYPVEQKQSIAPLIASARLLVWESRADSLLSDYLRGAGLEFKLVHDGASVGRHTADLLIVGPDAVSSADAAQVHLAAITKSGTNTLVLYQPRAESLAGFQLRPRRITPASLVYLQRSSAAQTITLYHPMPIEDHTPLPVHSLLIRSEASIDTTPMAWITADTQLTGSANTAGLAASGTTDSLLLQSQIGRGRIILCQQPIGDPATDARAGLFLVRAIDELIAPISGRSIDNQLTNKTNATMKAGAE